MMEDKSDETSVLRAVSWAFNVSETYSEFKMRLGILGIDENEALSTFKRNTWFDRFCKYHSIWDFTFELAFKKRNKPIDRSDGSLRSKMVLPCFFGKTIRPDTFTPELKVTAIGIGDKEITHSLNPELSEDIGSMHGIDMTSELFNILMYEIGADMYPGTAL
jgi:hypothetical protein